MADGGQRLAVPETDRPPPQPVAASRQGANPGGSPAPHDIHRNGPQHGDGQHNGAPGDAAHHDAPHPPAPLIAPTNPALVHPANAPLRAAAMARLQRGIGNQAAQAMLAAAAPSREADDAEDMEPPEAASEEPQAEAPGPRQLTLRADPIRGIYLGQPVLQPGELSFPPPRSSAATGERSPRQPPTTAPDLSAEASRLAVRRHAELRAVGEMLHESALGHLNRTIADTERNYREAVERLDADGSRVALWLDSLAEQQRAALDSAAQIAQQRLEGAAAGARVTVRSAAADGLRQLDITVGRAAGAISAAVTQAIGVSLKAIADEKDACTRDGDSAIAAVVAWGDKPDKDFPGVGPKMAAAMNEVRRQVVPELAKQVVEGDPNAKPSNGLRAFKTEQLKAYDVWTAARPGELQHGQTAIAMRNAIATSRREAHQTIQQAETQSLAGIDELARSGRRMLAQMRRNGRAQLTAQRQAAKARLDMASRGRRASLHSETASTLGAAQTAGYAGLAPFARDPDGLRMALRNAALRGPDAVLQVARSAPPTIEVAMANARRLHGDRVAANAATMRGMALIQQAQHTTEIGAEQARAETELSSAAAQSTLAITQTTDTQAAGIATTAAKVAEAATQLVTSLSDSFAKQLVTAKHGLDTENKNFAGEPPDPATTDKKESKPDGKDDAKVEDPKAAPGTKANEKSGAKSDAKPGAKSDGDKAAGKPGDTASAQGKTADQTKERDGTAEKLLEPKTLGQRRAVWQAQFNGFKEPEKRFGKQLDEQTAALEKNLEDKLGKLDGAFDVSNLGKAAHELRGTSAIQGEALQELQKAKGRPRLEDELYRLFLDRSILHPYRDRDYYHAALAYLHGQDLTGARYELQAVRGVFSASFGDVQDILNSLSDADRKALIAEDINPPAEGVQGASLADIREHLSGTDLKVLDAWEKGEYARAEALKLFERFQAARREGSVEKLKEAADALRGGPSFAAYHPKDYRTEVVAELAKLVPPDPGLSENATAADKVLAYATKPMEIYVPSRGRGDGGGYYRTIELKDDDAKFLLEVAVRGPADPKDPAATQAMVRAVGLHEELTRPDGPRVGELTKLLIDKRLDPIRTDLTGEALKHAQDERDAAIKERDAAIIDYARRYGGADANVDLAAATQFLKQQVEASFHEDRTGAEFAFALAKEAHPTGEAAAIGLDWAINHPTTIDSEIVHGILSHMDRDEIEIAKTKFKQRTGDDLLAQLHVYGHGGLLGGLSGDDRLQAERDLLGVPRDQKEDLEVQHFAIDQQRRETGFAGRAYARGSYSEQQMNQAEAEMFAAVGKPLAFDREGHLLTSGVFDAAGKLIGGDPERLKRANELSQIAVTNYTAVIDHLSEMATTIIAVLGAIAAVVITVVTAGAAGPLVAAALITGLATMAAKGAIRGGRYGWKEAGLDLGMTAVQMLTAGVGAALGAASRGGMAAIRAAEAAEAAFSEGLITAEAMEAAAAAAKPGQLLGSQLADHALIGASTGAISGAGQTALSPDTWKEGGEKGAEEVIFGLFRGALSGLVTSVASQKFEGIGFGTGANRVTIGSLMQSLGKSGRMPEQMVLRGLLRAASSSVGAMAGRGTEIGFDAASGRFRGNARDAFESILETGWQTSLRGFAEGMAEAPAARYRQGILSSAARRKYGEALPPQRSAMPDSAELVPRATAGTGEPGGEAPAERPPPEAPLRRPSPLPEVGEPDIPPEEGATPAPRLRPPRAPGEPPEPEPAPPRLPPEIEELPDQSVVQAPNSRDVGEAQLIYGNMIADTPDREAAIYFNPETGEYIVVQGVPTTVAVAGATVEELEVPQPAGFPQRWKEVLEGGDAGRWELLAHFHPPPEGATNTSLPLRLPSGYDGDFATIDAESVFAGDQPRSSRIHYLQNGRYGYTDFGVDPGSPNARYWVDYADPVTGARSRETFGTIAQYHEWYEGAFGRPPSAARTAAETGGRIAAPRPPRLPESGAPPRAIRDEIDNLLVRGPTVEHPPAETVAAAALAFRQGKGTLGDFEVLLKQAAADARLALSARTRLEGEDHRQYVLDISELSWSYLTGKCGGGRDYLATSLATFAMDAETPLTIRRYQAANVFGVGQHGFAVVEVPGEPPARFLIDPTFAQFMRPKDVDFHLNQATANFLAEHPDGAFTARDLLRNGYMPLTQENAALYAQAMGVDPAEAAAVGTRLFGAENADLTELVGGPQRRPPVTRIESNNLDVLSAEDVEGFIGEPIGKVTVRDGRDEAVLQRLSEFRERVREAIRRGPVLPEQERVAAATPTAAAPTPGGEPEGPAAAAIPISPTFRTIRGGPPPLPEHVAAVRAEVPAALDRLEATKALPDVEWERTTAAGPNTILVARPAADQTELVRVSFVVGDTRNGEPATFPPEPTRNPLGELELVVTVSRRHPPDIVEQAIAHEITEIAHPKAEADRLAPGGGEIDPAGPLAQLSGHDRGRLAQIATLSRQIAGIEASEAAARRSGVSGSPSGDAGRDVLRMRNEAELLAAHLGLVHGAPDAVAARRALALRALADRPQAAKLLAEAIDAAFRNPLLQIRTGSLADLDILARRRTLAVGLGQEEILAPERSLLGSAEDIAVAAGLVGRDDSGRVVRAPKLEEQARELLSDEGWRLLQIGIARAASRREPTSPEEAMAWEINKLAGSEEQRELVRQRFADRPNYTDLDKFLAVDPQHYFRKTAVERARMQAEWMRGKFIAESGLPVSLVNNDQPDLGFAVLPGDLTRIFTGDAALAGPAAAAMARERVAAFAARDELIAALKAGKGTAPTGAEKDLKRANRRINLASELGGVLAGDDFAMGALRAEMSDLKPMAPPIVTVPEADISADISAGANTIDLGYESLDANTLVVIECKGGEAERGTRLDITGQLRVEQGTREYLEAVAATMEARGATEAERDFGRKLLVALQTGSKKVRYLQVRQPFDPLTGAPEPYIVDQFDLRPRRPPGK
jgi:hypothetical protein